MTQEYAQQIADDFTEFLDEFHRYEQPYDDAMDAELHEQYARILREQSKWGYFPFEKGLPIFGPSSAGKSDRELYEKLRKSPKDNRDWTPNQRDWVGLGSEVGSYIQREIMLAERHFKRLTGKEPRFKFERTDRGEPSFEHFRKVLHKIDYGGQRFALFGLPDGILEYTTNDGEVLRVGLEVKSSQKSYNDFKRLSQPKPSHEAQTACYSEMYGLDYYVILYHFTAGRGWDEDFSRNKAFGKYITAEERERMKMKLANVVSCAKCESPPPVDLLALKFNDYKTHIALTMTDDELATAKHTVKQAQKGNLPAWKKAALVEAWHEIQDIREGEARDGI